MPSQKLVRCLVRAKSAKAAPTARYIPLEIFGLWDFLMTSRHGFEVIEPRASLWLDMEDSPEAAYSQNQYDRVTEVSAYVYSERDDMFTRARRYFRSDEADSLKRIFLSHYQGEESRIQTQVHERSGIWIVREAIAGRA
jgi:hypothetical protein